MNLVIDFGNTHTKIAWFDSGTMNNIVQTGNSDYISIIKNINSHACENAIFCSVGKIKNEIITSLKKQCHSVLRLDKNTPLPISIVYKTPDSLGYDRIASASGAHHAFPGENVLIFDFGTAITIDFLSLKGEYLGGNISPGLHMRFKSLSDYTSSLPLVEKDEAHPLFGDDTQSAIAAGVQTGINYEVSGYIEEFVLRHANCRLVATGGDAEFIISGMKKSILLYPDLVMEGLNYILEYNTITNS